MPTGGSERASKQQRVASAVYAVDVHVFILSFIFYYMYITAPTQDATVLASKCPAARNSNDLCAFTTFYTRRWHRSNPSSRAPVPL